LPISIHDSKKDAPKFLSRITSGKELLNIVANSHGYRTDYDEVENEEDAEYIGSIFQSLVDYGDIYGMVETYDRVKMGFQLNQLLKEIEEKGYFLFGEKNREKISFKTGDDDQWNIATIVIKRKDNSEIITVDLS